MSRIDRLLERYKAHLALPWRQDLAAAERAIFIVYDKTDERRLRTRLGRFEEATKEIGHGWVHCDLTDAFATWMASLDYQESYFESPEDIALKLDEDFPRHLADRVRAQLALPTADANAVVAVTGVASLFGFTRVSKLMQAVENGIRGRLVVFFPGEYENSNYRLLDARDGWSYLAVPITVHDQRATYRLGRLGP